jgi:WD40 repeat protein
MTRRVSLEGKIFRLAPILALFLALTWPTALDGQKTQEEASPILIPLKGLVNINRNMSLPGQGRVEMIGFSPDGRYVAMAGGGGALLWDPSSGTTRVLTVPAESAILFCTFDFSPDGQMLATVMGRGKLVLWDLKSGSSRVINRANSSFNVAYSPDGKSLVMGANSGGLEVWDVLTGKKTSTFLKKKDDTYSRVAFTPDGKHIAASYKGERIVLVEVSSGNIVKSFSGHQDYITDFVISRDGKTLASGGYDKRIIVWDIDSGEKLKDINPLPDRVNDLDISPDGRLVAAAIGPMMAPWVAVTPETSVMIIDLEAGEGRAMRVPFCYSVAFSADGKFLATGISSGEEVAIIWDISSYGIAEKFKKDPFETTAEYEARVGQIEIPYSETIALSAAQYNADRGGFEIQFKNNKLLIQVEREVAKELIERKTGTLRMSGRLKYHNPENLKLDGAVLEDTVTGKKFTAVKNGEIRQEAK